MMTKVKVAEEMVGKRLDQALTESYLKLNRSQIKKLIENGKVKINNKRVSKTGVRLKSADLVDVDYKEEKVQQIKLPVLYEDTDCIVLNKPAGILTHSKGSFYPEATVATFISKYLNVNWLKSEPHNNRLGIVHRLDRGTSGVLIAAKNDAAHKWLQKQFSTRKTVKKYIAIVLGAVEPKTAIIEVPIGRNPKKPQTFRAHASGKPAVTKYRVIKTYGGFSMLELLPETGRTHQLRVHLNYIKHPVLGDTLYGNTPADRMYLHAQSLEITLPSKIRKTFVAPLPQEFNKLMK